MLMHVKPGFVFPKPLVKFVAPILKRERKPVAKVLASLAVRSVMSRSCLSMASVGRRLGGCALFR